MALRELLVDLGVKIDKGGLAAGKAGVEGLAGSVRGLGTMLATGVAAVGVVSFVKGIVTAGDNLGDLAAQLNVSAGQLQKWQFLAESGGASADDLATGLKFVQKNASEAADGGSAQTAAFKALGVSIKDSSGQIKPAQQLFEDVGIALSKTKDGSQRTALSMTLLGRSGNKLAPIFAQGAEGLAKLNKRFEELGGGLSQEAIDQAGEADQKFRELGVAFSSLKDKIALQVLPTLNKLTTWLSNTVAGFTQSKKGPELLEDALIALGVTAAVVGFEMLAPFLVFAIIVAVAALAVDDLRTFVKGGKSVTQDFLELIFGKQAGDSIAIQIRKDFADLSTELNKQPTWVGKWKEGFSIVSASAKKFLIDDIPAATDALDSRIAGGQAGWTEALLGSIVVAVEQMGIGGALSGVKFIEQLGQSISNGEDAVMAAVNKILDKVDSRVKEVALNIGTLGTSGAIEGGIKAVRGSSAQDQAVTASHVPQVSNPNVFGKALNQTVSQNNNTNITIQGNADAADVKNGVDQGNDAARRAAFAAFQRPAG